MVTIAKENTQLLSLQQKFKAQQAEDKGSKKDKPNAKVEDVVKIPVVDSETLNKQINPNFKVQFSPLYD